MGDRRNSLPAVSHSTIDAKCHDEKCGVWQTKWLSSEVPCNLWGSWLHNIMEIKSIQGFKWQSDRFTKQSVDSEVRNADTKIQTPAEEVWDAERKMLGKGRVLLISSPSAWGRISRKCAVQCMSLWSNPGQIITSSYAVAAGWGKGLVTCSSALSEKGLYYRFGSARSAEKSPCFCSACL